MKKSQIISKKDLLFIQKIKNWIYQADLNEVFLNLLRKIWGIPARNYLINRDISCEPKARVCKTASMGFTPGDVKALCFEVE